MDKLKKLELNRLIRELEFIQSDYDYKSEIVQKADVDFLESVNKVVDSHPELKEIYDQRVRIIHQQRIEKIQQQTQEEIIEVVTEAEEVETISKDPKIKNLYRNIVKKTHPDKISESDLNELYLESTKHYENDDILELYKICDTLGISYEFEDNDYFLIQNKILQLRDKIKFLESTFTWLWINSEDSRKEEIVLSFVRLQIF